MQGKGQFICGSKTCQATQGLCSYEVLFAYKEADEKKEALVKLRVCQECAVKLNFKSDTKRKKHDEKHVSSFLILFSLNNQAKKEKKEKREFYGVI